LTEAHAARARLRRRAGDMPGALANAARVAAMEEEWLAEMAGHPHLSDYPIERRNLDEA